MAGSTFSASAVSRLLLGVGVLLHTGCGFIPRKAAPMLPATPATQGWGLMMDPQSLAAPAGATGEASAAGAPLPDGGTPSSVAGGMFDFSSVTGGNNSAMSRVAWRRSAMDATEEARRTSKPLLILANHRNSSTGKSMENTLVLQPEFKTIVEENYIPLYMDFGDESTAKSDLYLAFKQQLKVRGYPTLLVTLPDGTEILRLSGYKTEYAPGYLLKVKNSVEQSQKAIAARRTRLEGSGFRLWTDKKGVPVFAKLNSVDANLGSFTGEWGAPFTTFITRLSEADQAWIAQKKGGT